MPKRRPDHVPSRTCAVCREQHPKREMTRVVRSPAGAIAVDPTGRAAGRGTYICDQPGCRDAERRRAAITRALGGDPPREVLEVEGAAHATT